ncbi:hypothetical protein AB0O07_12515 [Streptomyces sp. NPDC093085]|uniref:hypothetical protein n=1 Tax=Streptomyces sp. NPDC093085 TaxID=3155068 RepID=UPI00344684F2
MRKDRISVLLATPAVALSLALTAGCGANDENASDEPKTATGSLEELAEQAKCDPDVQKHASEELRQANCTTDDGKYILITFATDRGVREWLHEAKPYGGSYLVGRKWVAVGDEKVTEALRGRLGGTVETGSSHHSGGSDDDGGGSTDHEGHEGHEGS